VSENTSLSGGGEIKDNPIDAVESDATGASVNRVGADFNGLFHRRSGRVNEFRRDGVTIKLQHKF